MAQFALTIKKPNELKYWKLQDITKIDEKKQ